MCESKSIRLLNCSEQEEQAREEEPSKGETGELESEVEPEEESQG